jgi:hypothetical protein
VSERLIQSQRSAALHLVGVVVASMGALFLVWGTPPTFRRMWMGAAHSLAVGLGVGHFTVVISVALALFLVTRVRDRLDAHSLALSRVRGLSCRMGPVTFV